MKKVEVEITGKGDGISFTFYPESKMMVWTEKGLKHTTQTERKEWENNILKQFEK